MTIINPNIKISKRRLPEASELYKKILEGDRFELSRAITLIESEDKDDKIIARDLIEYCLSKDIKPTLRIGISGSPGSGKSTLLEALGMFLTGEKIKPAVLTVDPTSSITSGSILGDKTRMSMLSNEKDAYVRTSPAGSTLGGVNRYTREALMLTETAGFDPVFIETVGVGQSETEVAEMTDLFIYLLQPGSGDDLQGIKRGIMEIADIIVINKYDSDNTANALNTYGHFSGILEILPLRENGWQRKIHLTSAIEKTGISDLWDIICQFKAHTLKNGYYEINRKNQKIKWFQSIFLKNAVDAISGNTRTSEEITLLKNKILENSLSPYEASEILLSKFLKKI